MEAKAAERDSRRSAELHRQREIWDGEILRLGEEVDAKLGEREELEAENRREFAERAQTLAELNEQLRKLEYEWVEGKQKVAGDWDVTLAIIQHQFSEEERQNEGMRKLPLDKCQKVIDDLKRQLDEDESNWRASERSGIELQIDSELKRHSEEMTKLQAESDRLTAESRESISNLEGQIRAIEAERKSNLIRAREAKRAEIFARGQAASETRTECAKLLNEARFAALQVVQDHELKLANAKLRVEQTKIDSRHEIATLEVHLEHEMAHRESRARHELELMAIELQKVQRETEEIAAAKPSFLHRLSEVYNEGLRQEQRLFRDCQQQLALEDESRVAAEERILEFAMVEAVVAQSPATDEDMVTIAVLEDTLDERKVALLQASVDYGRYENSMIDLTALLSSLGGSPNRVIVASPSSVQKKAPLVVEPVTAVRRSRSSL
jgi:hypothetical protein